MIRKLWVVLLVLAFLLGSISGFWLKPTLANTGEERKVMLCVAEPWGSIWYTAPGSGGKDLKPQEGQGLRPSKASSAEAQSLGSKTDAPSLIKKGEKKRVPSPDWRLYLIWFYQVVFR